jgi:hypothetical protein
VSEELVFLGLWAVSALEAGDKEDGYPCCDQHGKDASVHRNPMCQGSHRRSPFRGYDPVNQEDFKQEDFSRRLRISKKCYPTLTIRRYYTVPRQ